MHRIAPCSLKRNWQNVIHKIAKGIQIIIISSGDKDDEEKQKQVDENVSFTIKMRIFSYILLTQF